MPSASFAPLLATAMAGPSTLYFASQRQLYPKWRRRVFCLPALMAVGIGLAVSNGRAVMEGFFGSRAGEFVRTPKRGDRPGGLCYRLAGKVGPIWEIAVGAYCAMSLYFYLHAENYLIGPFLALYTVGFLFIGLAGLLETFAFRWRPAREAASGFPAFPLMEDVEWSLRLKRISPILYLGDGLMVSDRRWRREGRLERLTSVLTLYLKYRLRRGARTAEACYRSYYP